MVERPKNDHRLSTLKNVAACTNYSVADLFRVEVKQDMNYNYKIRTDKITDESNAMHTVYGIEVWNNDELLKSIPDVFLDLERAQNLIALLNSEKLDLIHLMDVIEDELD